MRFSFGVKSRNFSFNVKKFENLSNFEKFGGKMEKVEFIEFLKTNVLSIFTGSEIVGEEVSSPRDALVALGTGGSLLVKFRKEDEVRLVIKRIQPFKNFEVNLVKAILTELLELYNGELGKGEYFPVLQNHVIEKAICKSVSETSHETILKIVTEMSKWGNRTYEGQRALFGFLICSIKAPKNVNPNLHISKILNENFGAVIADGMKTCLKISSDGYLLNYLQVPDARDHDIPAPFDYIDMGNMCTGSRVGVTLSRTGDILLFHQKSMVFAKKCGVWSRYSHEEIISRIADKTSELADSTRKAIYLSALDVSFARTGGCVVHLDKDQEENVLRHIDVSDILIERYYDIKCNQNLEALISASVPEEQLPQKVPYNEFITQPRCTKTANIINMINGRKFYELSRKLRQELLSVDGATIINNEGDVVAVGAIIMIETGGFSGGRLAASKTLSKYGVSLKISADGQIQGFKLDRHKQKAVPIFMLG